MECLESVLVDVGVDLGGGNIGMAKHKLHGAQVGAMGQEVGGEGVAQHVRGNGLVDICCLGCCLDDLPETESGHGMAAVADKKDVAAAALENKRAGGFKVVFDDFPGRNAKGDKSLFIALTNDPNEA